MKNKKTYEELAGVEKEVCDLCRYNQKACDSNTDLCIAFWWNKGFNQAGRNIIFINENTIRKYPPESLTKYRRNLVEWGLITPSENSRRHSREMEEQNHKKDYQFSFDNEIKFLLGNIKIEKHNQNRLFKTQIIAP